MADQANETVTYDDVFDRQGIDESGRSPEYFFFYTVTEADAPEQGPTQHAGETYAIPRSLGYEDWHDEDWQDFDGRYNIHENGSMISERAALDADVSVGSRTLIHSEAIIKTARLGRACIVGARTRLEKSSVYDHVIIGESGKIAETTIWQNVQIGAGAIVNEGSEIRSNVVIGNFVRLDGQNTIGAGSKIGTDAQVGKGADLEREVTLDERSSVGAYATVSKGSRVLTGAHVKERKLMMRTRTIVYPDTYKRARKSSSL